MFPIGDDIRAEKKPYVNNALIIVNFVIFLYFQVVGLESGIEVLGFKPIDLFNGRRLYTILTSMFMHANILHLLGNMLYLYIFGDDVEGVLGHWRYLLFYIISGLGAHVLHILSMMLVNGLSIPTVGASGAISGVLAAFLVLWPRARVKTLVVMWFYTIVYISAKSFIAFWFIYQVLMGAFELFSLRSSVAWFAHIGGFLTGFIIVRGLRIKKKEKSLIILYR